MWLSLLAPLSSWAKANAGRLWAASVVLFFILLTILLIWLWVASIRKDAVQSEKAAQLTRELTQFREAALATQKLADALEQTLADQKTVNTQLNERLDNEIAKNGVYRACVLPGDGLRLYNAAIRGTAAR